MQWKLSCHRWSVYRNAKESCGAVARVWEELQERRFYFLQCWEKKANGLLLALWWNKVRFLFLNEILQCPIFTLRNFLAGKGWVWGPFGLSTAQETILGLTGHILTYSAGRCISHFSKWIVIFFSKGTNFFNVFAAFEYSENFLFVGGPACPVVI